MDKNFNSCDFVSFVISSSILKVVIHKPKLRINYVLIRLFIDNSGFKNPVVEQVPSFR